MAAGQETKHFGTYIHRTFLRSFKYTEPTPELLKNILHTLYMR